MKLKWYLMVVIFTTLCLIISGCTGGMVDPIEPALPPTSLPTVGETVPVTTNTAVVTPSVAPVNTLVPPATLPPPAAPSPTPISLSKITLTQGDFYFKIDGKPGFIFSRNLSGEKPDDWAVLAAQAHQRGDLVVRVGTENSFMGGYFGYGYTSNGEVREDWSKNWEKFLDICEDNGIYVFPFFSGWINWDPNYLSGWAHNPINSVNGGPAKDSSELFKKDSPTQLLFLKWFKEVVMRWSKHDNILAWEPIGEVNLFKGVTEKSAIYFIEQLAKIVRENDPLKRPVTFSLAGNLDEWPNFYRSDAIDFINIHPYPSAGPSSGQLDRAILADSHSILDKYEKPVMIGESGLSSDSPDRNPPTYTTAARATVGIEHAIWIAMVSGVMNGRALWFEDSYALYFPALSWSFLNKYMDAEVPTARFIKGVDYSNFKPLAVQTSSAITGGAIGSENFVIGWFRDAKCEPPNWWILPIITKQTVNINPPGTFTKWKVDFYNTKDGTTILGSTIVDRKGNILIIPLPDFNDDIAFKMTAQLGSATTMVPDINSDAVAGKWSGTITNTSGTFSTLVTLDIQAGCKPGRICGTFSAPKLSCSGKLMLKEVVGDKYIFIEQNVTGDASCASGGYEYLQPLANGTLSYSFSFTIDSSITSKGILQRQ